MSLFDRLRSSMEDGRAVVLVTVIAGPAGTGAKALVSGENPLEGVLPSGLDEGVVLADARELLGTGTSDTRVYDSPTGRYELFFDVFLPPPRLVIVGAVQTAQSLTRIAKDLDYEVTVTDARGAFATRERFPEADRVIKGWPQDVLPTIRFDESTYVVLLSHDPKFDEPTLRHVLPLPVPYVGAIGSRRTQQQRRERLRADGFDGSSLDKLYGPVGLDLGGRSAEEIAVAIMAEIIAVRNRKTGGMMSRRER